MPHFTLNTIRRDLDKLISLLRTHDFDNILEIYQLEITAGKLNKNNRDYSIDDMTLTVNPSGQKAKPEVGKLEIVVNSEYTFKESLSETEDIFDSYALNIGIKGIRNINPQNEEDVPEEQKFFCWHLDRELNTDGRFCHPLYHFQAGGKHIYDHVDEKSQVVFISSPRLPHPPMDVILLVHFIIHNFVNTKEIEKKQALFEDDEYKILIERAEKRILDPYFKALSKGLRHNTYTRHNLFPLYTV